MRHNIDPLDAKILRNLLQNGRKSFAEIAEGCGVSINMVRKHFAKMKAEGIIVGATVQMDCESFDYAAIATILLTIESQHLESTFDQLKQMPNVLAIRQFNSPYGIRLVARMKNMKELERIREAIRLHSSVTGLRTYFWLAVKNIPENLTFGVSENEGETGLVQPQKACHISKAIAMDEQDKNIVNILSQEGRMPFRRISAKTGLSTDTVIRRYERLVKSGTIKVSIQIDPGKLGYCANLDFSIGFAFQKETAGIVESLTKIPNVIIITKTSGDYDLQVTAMVRDTEEQFRIQEQIAKMPNIAKIETAARRLPNKWPTESQQISTF